MVEQAAHFLVPRHQRLSEDEKKKFFASTGLRPDQLPKIFASDPALRGMEAVEGDVVCVFRKADADPRIEAPNYRLVIK